MRRASIASWAARRPSRVSSAASFAHSGSPSADRNDFSWREVLFSIRDTPISPELLPPDATLETLEPHIQQLAKSPADLRQALSKITRQQLDTKYRNWTLRQITHHIAADGDVVFLDHTEKWTFKSGETAQHTFATMHEIRDGLVYRWSDYWDMQKFVGQFPEWFIEEMIKASAEDFTD